MPPAAMGMTPFGWHSFSCKALCIRYPAGSRRRHKKASSRSRLCRKTGRRRHRSDLRFPRTSYGSCKDLYPGRCIQPGLSARCRQRLHNIGQFHHAGCTKLPFPAGTRWSRMHHHVQRPPCGTPGKRASSGLCRKPGQTPVALCLHQSDQ